MVRGFRIIGSDPFVRLGAGCGLQIGGSTGQSRSITVDNTSGNELIQYQVKITLVSGDLDFSTCAVDGSDIRIYDSDGSIIPYYIKAFNRAGETAEIWARVPYIAATSTHQLTLRTGQSNVIPVPPIGLFTHPAASIIAGDVIGENMVFDPVTNLYYIVYTISTLGGVGIASCPTPDGTWTDLGSILGVGSAGTWDDVGVYAPHLLLDDGTWYLYYSGRPGNDNDAIGYATASSVTGPYTKSASNPVLLPTGTGWERYRACEPYVYYSDILAKWVLLYMGDAGSTDASQIEQVGYATSSSVTGPWTRYASNPAIAFGGAGSYDAGTIADPFAIEVNGTAYIFYTAGVTAASPWVIAVASTTDYVTFRKIGVLNGLGTTGEWDAANSFRGAISKFGDYYYLVTSTLFGIGVGKLSALPSTKGFNPNHVFDYFDDFDGAALDGAVWVQPAAESGSGSVSFSNSVMTITGLRSMTGRRIFGAGYIIEAYTQHPNANGDGTSAGEIGLSNPGRTLYMRQYDYNAANWFKESKNSSATTSQMSQAIDTNWHTHRIAWVSGSSILYSLDDNAAEEITTNIPTVLLPPWLFMFRASGTKTMLVDWVRVRKYAAVEPTVTVG